MRKVRHFVGSCSGSDALVVTLDDIARTGKDWQGRPARKDSGYRSHWFWC